MSELWDIKSVMIDKVGIMRYKVIMDSHYEKYIWNYKIKGLLWKNVWIMRYKDMIMWNNFSIIGYKQLFKKEKVELWDIK